MNNTMMSEEMDETKLMEFYAHRYKSDHGISICILLGHGESKALSDAGFDLAIKGIAERFGYDNMTCFHNSWMGMTHCNKSKMHTDIYATDDKSWNIIFPLITVEGSDAELDIMPEDMNTIVGVNYLKDVAYVCNGRLRLSPH
mmetsp:Transcript_19161/g.46010  ORF Transcript_19161/g.46010 Transcript_19161/m.46010 type:complete len:143 (-) Transcript_19161:102-530(-)